jgi:hypothetical protein
MKKILKYGLIALVAIIVLGLLFGGGDDNTQPQTNSVEQEKPNVVVEEQNTEVEKETNLSESELLDNPEVVQLLKNTYINACVDEGAKLSTCTCMYNYLENKFGFKGLVEISQKGGSEVDAASMDAAINCINE